LLSANKFVPGSHNSIAAGSAARVDEQALKHKINANRCGRISKLQDQ
jgi:hypothetical protein